jgi:hypothetical protein
MVGSTLMDYRSRFKRIYAVLTVAWIGVYYFDDRGFIRYYALNVAKEYTPEAVNFAFDYTGDGYYALYGKQAGAHRSRHRARWKRDAGSLPARPYFPEEGPTP